MPLSASAVRRSAIDIKKREPDTVGSALTGPGGTGSRQWLDWLQRLLDASSLMLYRFDSTYTRPELVACLPDVSQPAGTRYSTLAERCVQRLMVVRAVSSAKPQHSVLCIPDTSGVQGKAKQVLVIERRTPTKLDQATQVKLVAWAFQCLDSFFTASSANTRVACLSQWSHARMEGSEPLAVALGELMDQLIDVTGSNRSFVARLLIRHETVSSARLIALSGQQRVDNRLPASDSLVLALEKAYRGKTLPVSSKHQLQVAPSFAIEAPIVNAPELCARLMVPVYCSGQWYAVCLERASSRPYDTEEQAHLERELRLALAIVLLSNPQTRGVIAACQRKLRLLKEQIRAKVPRAVLIATACLMGSLYLFFPAEHRISATLSVEAAERHVLIAPVDGFVKSVAAKAGDIVEKGQILAALDDLDIRLQQQKLKSEIRQNQQTYAQALALHDRIEVTQLKEEASHLQTGLSQLALQSERMRLVAPVDGVVLSGSWDDSLGAAVSSGDALFTLGSTNSHRLVLDVSEYDVKWIQPGQTLGIRMSADPSSVLTGKVTAIMPLVVASPGASIVQVHAALDRSAQLRPGMLGIGKVLVGKRARLAQWLERAVSRLVWLGWKLGVLR